MGKDKAVTVNPLLAMILILLHPLGVNLGKIYLEPIGKDLQKEKGKRTAGEAVTYISSCQKQPWEYFSREIIPITGLKEMNEFFSSLMRLKNKSAKVLECI